MISRRSILSGLGVAAFVPVLPRSLRADSHPRALVMPRLVDATQTRQFSLHAQAGETDFLGREASETWGFNQPFLGPTLRLSNKGETLAEVTNSLNEAISVHWHGLVVPGDVDGGPHQMVQPGQT